METMISKNVEEWSSHEVANWLRQTLPAEVAPETVATCIQEQQIDGEVLLSMRDSDFRDSRLELTIGQAKHLERCVKQLQGGACGGDCMVTNHRACSVPRTRTPMRLLSVSEDEAPATAVGLPKARPPPVEYFKLILATVYCSVVYLLTAFTMVLVHDRVPDMQRWPPLPDMFLDLLPYMPWAFAMCEYTALILGAIFVTILFLHKHRSVILRRFMLLMGTMFLLRCITMLITSLSVPGTHLDCRPTPNATLESKLERTFVIWSNGGMALRGVRTCGDYMFSGHTVFVTMYNFFITEYSSPRFHMLHTMTWVMNLFGIFFILAAHEHYSIDVFIAFYITSRLFLYYHSLANNRALRQPDRKRTMLWFPMFGYFEANVDGMVPYEYEWPMKYPKSLKHYMDTNLFVHDKHKKSH